MGDGMRTEEEWRNDAGPESRTSENASADRREEAADPGQRATVDDDHAKERAPETAEEVVFRVRHLALISSNYHKAREAFLEKAHRVTMLCVLVLGSAAAADLFSGYVSQKVLAFAGAFAGAVDMTYAYGRQAREHALLGAKFVDILGALAATSTRDEAVATETRFYTICAEEPPVYEAVAALAYNQALGVLPDKQGLELEVPWLHRRLRNWVRFSNHAYRPAPAKAT